jgi:peptidoglycan/LPS O-acetylase OafA/YrhL
MAAQPRARGAGRKARGETEEGALAGGEKRKADRLIPAHTQLSRDRILTKIFTGSQARLMSVRKVRLVRVTKNHTPSPGSVRPAPRGLGRQPTFDGLRGVAWLVVFVAHANMIDDFAFGQVAMFVFFALSGFLITSLLVQEHAARGRVSLRNFFARRALRLLPALWLFLAAWLLAVAVLNNHPWITTVPGGGAGGAESITTALQGVGAAVGYFSNWFEINNLSSGYFPLGHLWSLAVEEQFYLIWAPLLIVVLRYRPRLAAIFAALLTVISLLDVVVIHHASSTTGIVDMGTDTRAGAFLAGAFLALCWTRRSRVVTWVRSHARVPTTLGVLGVMVWAAWIFDHQASVLEFGLAWVGVSLGAPVLIANAIDERTPMKASVLSHPIVVYLGQRSYALYLWHYVWLTWLRNLGLMGIVGAFAASLACAELSWRIVEAPALARKRRFSSMPAPEPSPVETPVLLRPSGEGGEPTWLAKPLVEELSVS